jgi:hypothetical protein
MHARRNGDIMFAIDALSFLQGFYLRRPSSELTAFYEVAAEIYTRYGLPERARVMRKDARAIMLLGLHKGI